MNLQYRTLLNDRSKFAAMDKLLSDERLDLAACSTEPVIIQRSKEQTKKYYGEWVRSVRTFGKQTPSPLLLNDENHSIRIDQLFSPDSDGNTPKTVILSGDSGRGKSFMLQKIMLDWASGELYSENFDAVFLLKCEEFKSISTEESLFYLLSLNHSLTSKQISKILQLTPEKVLILIDGMDEYVSRPRIHFMQHTNLYTKAPVMVILTNLLRRVLLPESFMLVTTRSAVDTVNLLKDPQRFTEIMGFSERGVQEYFQKFFQDEQLFRKMYERVKINESLLTACSVPLLCWMVCFCLKKHFTDDDHVMRELKTNTSIYVHLVSTLLEHHDQSQSVLTMLRSLGQLAEEGMKKQQVFFVGKSVTMKCFDAVTTLFLYKDGLKIKDSQKPAFRFMHHSFQEFFTALYYVLLDEENSWWKVSELLDWMEWGDIIDRPSPERRSNPIPSVMLFLCGLLNKKVSSSLFKKIQWTVPHTVKLKEKLQESVLRLTTHSGCELYALHCLYELQDERFVSEALKKHNFMDLSNISLRSTDCWVLLYCLQCCPHIRDLNLMYCDLTAEKLKILQPALCMCKIMSCS
uniref:NACHT domain-containing protein n=1 Tax=Cyprinus carpio TaxID=7962 RepID=A0A8C1UMV1_CYPCA